jgi:hypothetical protein
MKTRNATLLAEFDSDSRELSFAGYILDQAHDVHLSDEYDAQEYQARILDRWGDLHVPTHCHHR